MISIEEKRQSLYAALLRFTPEAGSLRDRAVDRIVLTALVGSTEALPFKFGNIQQNTRYRHDAPGLRDSVIKEALERLIGCKKVAQKELKKKNVYFLTDNGVADTEDSASSAAQLFDSVLDRMLADTTIMVDRETGAGVCRRFISECFARFGYHLAQAIARGTCGEETLSAVDVAQAFREGTQGVKLSRDASDSLFVRCKGFIHSIEPADQDLKFRLTQGYYIAQLLEMTNGQFDLITEEAFKGAVFFLDTNVIFGRILSNELSGPLSEVLNVAQRLGMELRVTRATINEARNVARSRADALRVVLLKAPRELAERANDEFLQTFLRLQRETPSLTPEDLLMRFDDIEETLRSLGIRIEERDLAQIVGVRDISEECGIINDAAIAVRRWGKSLGVQRHDAAHYLLVYDERMKGAQKTWFLTRDRTLPFAASQLKSGELPFCYPLLSFLQSISPFVVTPAEEHSLANLFSSVLNDEVHFFPDQSIFDLRELKLICELHEDILSTSPEQLVLAFDYVKKTVLDGKPYEEADHKKVALGLKKYLSSSAEEKQRGLLREIERQKAITAGERLSKEALEREIASQKEQAAQLEQQVKKDHKIIGDMEAETTEGRRRAMVTKAVLFLMGVLMATVLWIADSELAGALSRRVVLLADHKDAIPLWIRMVGSVFFITSSIPLLRSFCISKGAKLGLAAIVIAMGLAGSNTFTSETIARIADFLGIGTALSFLIYPLCQPLAKKGAKSENEGD